MPDDLLLEIYTALRPRRATAEELEEWAVRLDGSRSVEDRGLRSRGGARVRRPRTARGWLAAASPRARRATCTSSSSSRRFPTSGSWRRTGRTIPSPSSSSRTASSRAWTAGTRPTSTSSTGSSSRTGSTSRSRSEAMATDDLAIARMLVDVDVPRSRARPALARSHAGEARARHRAARPGRADARAEEAPRPPRSRESGARHEPQGEPRAPRGRRSRGGSSWLRRDRDDRRRRPVCAAQRDRPARRLADRPARRA